MEQLKHECGVAMIRLLKPLEYYDWLVLNWRPIRVKNICFANVP